MTLVILTTASHFLLPNHLFISSALKGYLKNKEILRQKVLYIPSLKTEVIDPSKIPHYYISFVNAYREHNMS